MILEELVVTFLINKVKRALEMKRIVHVVTEHERAKNVARL